ncbi:MAG: hypothetical protein WAQ24_00160 [Candidatus Saccharimonadales bacterium]
MNTKQTIVPRAIASVFFKDYLKKILGIPLVLVTSLVAVCVWLAWYFSGWWLLGLVVLAPILAALLGAILVAHFVSQRISPRKLSAQEAAMVRTFVARTVQLAEVARTPLPLLGIKVVWDMVTHRDIRTLQSVLQQSASLRAEYTALVKRIS